MILCPDNLESLGHECKYAEIGIRGIDIQIANAIGWTDQPPFTSSLDAAKILIELISDYAHFGVLKKKTGLYSAFITIDPESLKYPKLWSSTDVKTEILALCSAALYCLADQARAKPIPQE